MPLMACAAASMVIVYSVQRLSAKKFKSVYKIWDVNYLIIAAYQGIVCIEICDL